jgi:hypothetical protein
MKALTPSARALRLPALALLGGAAAGLAATGDIKASYREGRIASPWRAASAATPATPATPPQSQPQDPALAHAHGFALAAERGIARLADCRSVAAEFRPGCEDYAEARRGSSASGMDLDFGL